ncbi:DUF433 domain-containing protein [Actinoplanes sp. NPDC026619]|uniref:DUF433 domain-containing protein n=1 Tax=Actinoplanes sp. NPDC026619 TaxID=3155798 RepID=UPI0033E68C34
MTRPGAERDVRFTAPLLTAHAAGIHMGIPDSTIRQWAGRRDPIVHAVPAERNAPTLPFIALAEVQILRELRRAGLSMAHIRDSVDSLRRMTNEDFVLARNTIATDGGDLLYNAASRAAPEWVRAKDHQGALREVAERLITFISYADDGFAQRLRLRPYGEADVIIDSRFGWGQPVLAHSKVPVEAIADLFYGGESIGDIAEEYGITTPEVEAIIRVTARRAA